jgi:hypothetical protein
VGADGHPLTAEQRQRIIDRQVAEHRARSAPAPKGAAPATAASRLPAHALQLHRLPIEPVMALHPSYLRTEFAPSRAAMMFGSGAPPGEPSR